MRLSGGHGQDAAQSGCECRGLGPCRILTPVDTRAVKPEREAPTISGIYGDHTRKACGWYNGPRSVEGVDGAPSQHRTIRLQCKTMLTPGGNGNHAAEPHGNRSISIVKPIHTP